MRAKFVVYTDQRGLALATWATRSRGFLSSAGRGGMRFGCSSSGSPPFHHGTSWSDSGFLPNQKQRPPASPWDRESAWTPSRGKKKLFHPSIFVKLTDAIRVYPGGNRAGDGDPGKVLSPALFFCLSYTAVRDVSTLPPRAKANKKSAVIPTLRWSMP